MKTSRYQPIIEYVYTYADMLVLILGSLGVKLSGINLRPRDLNINPAFLGNIHTWSVPMYF